MFKYFSVLLGKIANGYVEVVGDCLLEEVKSPFDDPFFQFWDRFYTKKILRKIKKLFVDNREDAVKPNFHAVTFGGYDIAVLLEVPCIITEHNLTQQTITVR